MRRRVLSLLVMLTLACNMFSGAVSAVDCSTSPDGTCPYTAQDLQSFNNNTPFFDDSEIGACSATGAAGTITLSGGDNGAKVFHFFVETGYTPIQAAGIIGNMQHESGIDPLKYQGDEKDHQVPPSPGMGWGLVQWTPNTKITEYAKSVNKAAYELGTQLEFLSKQLDGTAPFSNEKAAGDDLKSTTTIEDAVRAFQGDIKIGGRFIGFERPASESNSLANRIGAAKLALETYSAGGTTTTSPATANATTTPVTSGCSGSGAVAGSAVQTAINYAWPDYHPAPYLVMKDSYRAAITKAQANHEYVGGLSHPGVDCGGFITRVMRDSGADPNYNWGPNDPRQGVTDQQQAYMDAHPEKYQNLGAQTSTANLQPGDIAINDVHTYMFVGNQPNFHGNSASASVSFTGDGWRTPMASPAFFSENGKPFIWYRLKG